MDCFVSSHRCVRQEIDDNNNNNKSTTHRFLSVTSWQIPNHESQTPFKLWIPKKQRTTLSFVLWDLCRQVVSGSKDPSYLISSILLVQHQVRTPAELIPTTFTTREKLLTCHIWLFTSRDLVENFASLHYEKMIKVKVHPTFQNG